jgi:RNA polymerase sigma-70 factor (family 1)
MNYKLLADEILLKLLKANDEAALREIYLRYWKSLYIAALKKVRSKEAAEEIVQNLIVSLWKKRETSTIQNLQCYLNTAVKYQVINYVKIKIQRERKYQHAISRQEFTENTSEDSLLINELSLAIDQAINMLPQKTQTVFRLSRLENHSVKDISSLMNISDKAVEYHITKSLKIMRQQLKDFILFELILVFLFLTHF